MDAVTLDRDNSVDRPPRPRTVAVIGGGFTGALFALKQAAQRPDWTIFLVEERARPGRGIAYGACSPEHLLNVPVTRMEIGLTPSFADWLSQRDDPLVEALDESGGKLGDAFVPRRLFGEYLDEQVSSAVSSGRTRIRHIQGIAERISPNPCRLHLSDGRAYPVDIVVLATGNLPSSFPIHARPSGRIIPDPWAPGALKTIARDAPILLLGTGLTMIDTVLALRAQGHSGSIDAVSRHGLLPEAHEAGGVWPAPGNPGAAPAKSLRVVRAAVREALAKGIPWQRVFDSMRPTVAFVWNGWSVAQRAQFLRHLRTRWDVHRHRMARRISVAMRDLIAQGRLRVRAGRILALDEHKDGVTVVLRPRHAKAMTLEVSVAINCTGPRTDIRGTSNPILKSLLAEGEIRPDPLGLGIETEDCAVRGATGVLSDWLYALGPLTRPAWWEVTAVPEINAQIERLVRQFSEEDLLVGAKPLVEAFLDLGAGI